MVLQWHRIYRPCKDYSERKWDLEWKAEVVKKRKAATNEGRRNGACPGLCPAAGKRRRGSLPLDMRSHRRAAL